MSVCSVRCQACERVAYQGGQYTPGSDAIILPFGDGQEVLTDLADAVCTQGDCPHTTTARARAAVAGTAPAVITRGELDALLGLVADRDAKLEKEKR